MCRPSRSAAHKKLRIILIMTMMLASSAHGDDVGNYLQQHGLKQLLAVHLEQQLEKATNEEKSELVLRLASIYAELLEIVHDPVQRTSLEERSRQLLQQAPANSADELRLALLRASYRSAEKIAENHRLRLATPEELETAKKTFGELVGPLGTLRQQLKQNVELSDRRMTRAAGAEAVMLGEAAEKAHNLLHQCTYFNAWSLYYQSWLNERPDNARAAELLFAELLTPEISSPRPQDISVDLRSVEAVARSVLGMGLCKSMSSSTATAISWIELLEVPSAFEGLRLQALVWKIAIHLEHGEYEDVREVLLEHKKAGDLPVAWLRLVAVYALEDDKRSRLADELVQFAVTELAAKGDLEQVLDLARRYGAEALGKSGFALQYVQGVLKYQEARMAHGGETPTLDISVVPVYEGAAGFLKAALAEADASKYPTAMAGCRRLIAWCRFFQSRFLDARSAFEEAASNMSGTEAAEALWMAIVALDKVVEAGGSADLQNQLAALTDRFLDQYPSSEHAPKLRLRRAVAQKAASPEAVAQLLAIPPASEVYGSAQRRAADLLYQLFRQATADTRLSFAGQFLNVALPLIGQQAREVDTREAAEAQRYIVRCRQVLEVAFTEGVNRPAAVRSALEALDELKSVPGIDLSPFNDEIDCRKLQERLATDDAAAAGAIADQLWNRDQASVWTRIAARAMFKHGHQLWKNRDSTLETKNRGLELVVRHGGRVLHEFKDKADGLDQSGAMGYYTAVADASMTLWQQNGDADRGKAALFLYERLLAKRANNASFLHAMAVLSEKLGDPSKALDCWRRLAAGSSVDSEPWYEAKFHLIQLLAASDPSRARQVMDQHKQLQPDYGPDPWGAKLKGLDAQIPVAAPASAPDLKSTISDSNAGGSII